MASVPTPPSGLLVIRNVQACCSCETLADEITEPGACRVLARSPFGYGHDPAGLAALGLVTVVPAGVLALLQAASSKLTAASEAAHRQARAVFLVFIRLCSRGRASVFRHHHATAPRTVRR